MIRDLILSTGWKAGFFAALVLVIGWAVSRWGKTRPNWGLLMLATVIVLIHDVALRFSSWTLLPAKPFRDLEWNWDGTLYATVLSLVLILFLPMIPRRDTGLTFRFSGPYPVRAFVLALLLIAAYAVGAYWTPPDGINGDAEKIAFMASMPGIDEELFYRGLLFALVARAFGRPDAPMAGFPIAVAVTSIQFGFVHGLSVSFGLVGFDPLRFAMAAVNGLAFAALRVWSGNLILPVLAHNAHNTVLLLL